MKDIAKIVGKGALTTVAIGLSTSALIKGFDSVKEDNPKSAMLFGALFGLGLSTTFIIGNSMKNDIVQHNIRKAEAKALLEENV